MRKLIITAFLVIFLFATYDAAINGNGILGPADYWSLEDKNLELQSGIEELKRKNTAEYDVKKVELAGAVKLYSSQKQEYEVLAEEQKHLAYESTDLYDIDFLWTKIGNYATNREVVIKFDVLDAGSGVAATDEYKVCDLEFTCIGNYIDITEFIYDIEDDDRFKFEITSFAMTKPKIEEVVPLYPENTPEDVLKQKVKATFKVKSLPINADTLTTTSSSQGTGESSTADIMQMIP